MVLSTAATEFETFDTNNEDSGAGSNHAGSRLFWRQIE